MSEEWRDVVGYEGLYQVSNQGRVKSLERTFIDKIGRERYFKERILKPGVRGNGYLFVILYAGGKGSTSLSIAWSAKHSTKTQTTNLRSIT